MTAISELMIIILFLKYIRFSVWENETAVEHGLGSTAMILNLLN